MDLASYQQYVQGAGYKETQARAMTSRHIRKPSAWARCTGQVLFTFFLRESEFCAPPLSPFAKHERGEKDTPGVEKGNLRCLCGEGKRGEQRCLAEPAGKQCRKTEVCGCGGLGS